MAETLVAPAAPVEQAPCLAAAEDQLKEEAALQPPGDENFRRDQLTMRSNEKEQQEAERAAAKEAKEAEPKAAAAKPRGRPRKTLEEVVAPKAVESKTAKTVEAKVAAQAAGESVPVEPAAKKRRTGTKKAGEAAGSGGPGDGSAPSGGPADGASDGNGAPRRARRTRQMRATDAMVDRNLSDDFLKVMRQFQKEKYNKEVETMHTGLLNSIGIY